MSNRRQTAHEAGFAVIDLLVAIAVAGLAASVLVGIVAFVERERAETARRQGKLEESLVLERVLRLLVSSSPSFLTGTPLRSAVAGNEHEMTVTSTGPPIISLPRAALFRLLRDVENSGSDVVLIWIDGEGQEQRTLVARGVSELTLAYLPLALDSQRSPTLGAAKWRSQWRAEEGPLAALRLAIRFGSASIPQVFVIPIEGNLPAACLRNPHLAGCARGGRS